MIGMQHAGELAGVSGEGLTVALRGIAKTSVDAARGGEEAGRAYRLLNINAAEFVKLPMDRQLTIVIDKLGAVENVALRNALAQQVMGKQAGEAMGLVAEGSEAFVKAAADAEAWGLAINRVDAAKLEMANDSIKRAEAAAKGLFTQIALAVAPGVKTLMDYFADSSAEARGFRDQVTSGSETAIEAIGKLADVIQGLRFAWVGAKLGVAEFFDAIAEGFSAAATTGALDAVGDVLKTLPGAMGLVGRAFIVLGKTGKDELDSLRQATSDRVSEIKAELDAIADEGLPGDKIVAQIKKVTAAMEIEAKKIAARRQEMMRGSAEDIPQDKGGQNAFDQRLAQQLEQIAANNELQLVALQRNFDMRQEVLNASLERGWITQEYWEGQSALIFAKYEAEKTKILDEETKKRYGISQVYHELDLAAASGFFGALGAMMSSHSRAAFNIGKAAAISQTIIDTYRAAQGAYAALAGIPIVGPALGAAAAMAAIVVGIARVQQIKATQFGGGSVGAGGAAPVFSANPNTGVPAAPISPLTGPVRGEPSGIEVHLTVVANGPVVGSDAMRELTQDYIAPALKDLFDNKDLVLINPRSRQALNLAPV
jgi:hypothetical protein